MDKIIQSGKLFGRIHIPASKSDAQRAILAAALSDGQSKIYCVGQSDDVQHMLKNAEVLGAKVEKREDYVLISGTSNEFNALEINVGESGLGLRLLASVAATKSKHVILTGEGSLLERSHPFFEEHLSQLGVQVKSHNCKLPITINGKLNGGKLVMDGSLSSQFLSGLLMALPMLKEDSELEVLNLRSIPYVQMTLDTLEAFGIKVENSNFEKFSISGNQKYHATKYAVESDWSSASYWLIAAALGHDVIIDGLSLESRQADVALLDALVNANCAVSADSSGIKVDGTNRKAFSFDATHCPDLFPALAVFAALCPGVSRIKGVYRLANKESDRGIVLQNVLGQLGVEIEIVGDLMLVTGREVLESAKVDSHGDHRIAMCLAIAGKHVSGKLEITNSQVVNKSYPEFWEHFEQVEL